ncbi:hypothetical protein SEMRO_645_G180580.1 [Seminavis robusta]|uniref:Uncharacterized protein n=1 Tax=Seminavis robusta TaxID=568900 RepID=A0A9N8E5M6_9STRA|nr:hypothetical protein SEMRO_645_G180580.1 [Seminavis robusta]|eukprot:Sro645_g180580.1 n/a (205) ;mRNA; f:6283-6897
MSWPLFLVLMRRCDVTVVQDHALGHAWPHQQQTQDDEDDDEHDGYSTACSSCCASHLECDVNSSDEEDHSHAHPAPPCRWQEDCPHSKCCPKLPCRVSEREAREVSDDEVEEEVEGCCSDTHEHGHEHEQKKHDHHHHTHTHDHSHNHGHHHHEDVEALKEQDLHSRLVTPKHSLSPPARPRPHPHPRSTAAQLQNSQIYSLPA